MSNITELLYLVAQKYPFIIGVDKFANSMVKPKRESARQRIERKAERNIPSVKKDDDVQTIISTAKTVSYFC